MSTKVLMDAQSIERALTRISYQIIEKNHGAKDICVIGIHAGGVLLAKKIAQKIALSENTKVSVGVVDISPYRDDLKQRDVSCELNTSIDFDVDDKVVVLVDDVLYTGRTVRAAIDAIMRIGRPKLTQLAVLIDRGHRELPIRADFVGKNVPTSDKEAIIVNLGSDSVVLLRREGEE